MLLFLMLFFTVLSIVLYKTNVFGLANKNDDYFYFVFFSMIVDVILVFCCLFTISFYSSEKANYITCVEETKSIEYKLKNNECSVYDIKSYNQEILRHQAIETDFWIGNLIPNYYKGLTTISYESLDIYSNE